MSAAALAFLILIAGAAHVRAGDAAGTEATCALHAGPIRTVTRIIDGETVALDDGSEVRLIGALAPRARDASAKPGAWPPETAAVTALETLALGKRVKLAYGNSRKDRYDRHLAQLFTLAEDGSETWLQGEMLAQGHARAYGLDGNYECLGELIAHENVARRNRAGLWSNGVYRVKRASRTGQLMTRRGHFEFVSGKVQSAAVTKVAVYLNFGSDWRNDFTVRIGRDHKQAFEHFSADAKSFEGQSILVRGWIESRNGPMINITDTKELTVGRNGPAYGLGNPASDEAPASASHDASPESERPAPPNSVEPGADDRARDL